MSSRRPEWPVFAMPEEIETLWTAWQSLVDVANLGPRVAASGLIRLEPRPRAELENAIRTVVRAMGPIITRLHEESLEPPHAPR